MPKAARQERALTVRWKGVSWNRLEKAKGKHPCKALGGQGESEGGGAALRGGTPCEMLFLQWAEQDSFISRRSDLGP